MKFTHYIFIVFFIAFALTVKCQSIQKWIDSIRIAHKILELGYAVVSSDSILAINVSGVQNIKTKAKTNLSDRFRLGSNTKTITSYIAALLVKQGKISYSTKFFDLFPELKKQSDSAYRNITLQELLTFRARLISWTYTNTEPEEKEIKGSEEQQRYAFISWVLKQTPDTIRRQIYWSNPSYVAAGLMLEKASGKSYEVLVKELGKSLDIDLQFGQPNFKDKNQPWGHDEDLNPEKPSGNYKLNWLFAAGNINVSLPDYSKFIQMQLQGLLGKSDVLSKKEFEMMHYGLPSFSYGWLLFEDEKTHLKYSFHRGNPGTFLSQVYVCSQSDRAFIFFTNVQSPEAERGLSILFEKLRELY